MPKPDRHYVACWKERNGLWSCTCEHPTVADAMRCLVPDGSAFLRAVEGTVFRSLNDSEFIEFLRAARQQPWHYMNKIPAGPALEPLHGAAQNLEGGRDA